MNIPMVFHLTGYRVLLTWTVLVVVTMISFNIGTERVGGTAVTVFVLSIATLKMRLIGLDFMGLRHAPATLRAAFEGYCLILWVVLSAICSWM